jgi:hypothetical protein
VTPDTHDAIGRRLRAAHAVAAAIRTGADPLDADPLSPRLVGDLADTVALLLEQAADLLAVPVPNPTGGSPAPL